MKKIIISIVCLVSIIAIIIVITSNPKVVDHEVDLNNISIKGDDLSKAIFEQFESYKDDLKENYKDNLGDINNKFNVLLALLGVIITVGLGLNIYNTINADDLKKIKNEMQEIKTNSKYLNDRLSAVWEESKKSNQESSNIREQMILLKDSLEDKINKLEDKYNGLGQNSNSTLNLESNFGSVSTKKIPTDKSDTLYTRVHFVLYFKSISEVKEIVDNERLKANFVNQFYKIANINDMKVIDHSVRFDSISNLFFIFDKYVNENSIRMMFTDILSKYPHDIWLGHIKAF